MERVDLREEEEVGGGKAPYGEGLLSISYLNPYGFPAWEGA